MSIKHYCSENTEMLQCAVDHSDENYLCEDFSAYCPFTGTCLVTKLPWAGETDQVKFDDSTLLCYVEQ